MTVDRIDVLVVGAGPTGLRLANQLTRRGVGAVIVDRNPGSSVQTKALGVQERTLEIYAKFGIVEAALAAGRRASGTNLWANGRHSARIPLGDIGRDLSPFPFLLILGQDENERLLGESLRTHAAAVQWSTELSALTQYDGHVQCTLKHANGSTRTVRARWVARCDGAHSAVRELNGIGFPGAPYEHVFLVADTLDHPENDRQLACVEIPRPSYFLLRPDGHIGHAGGLVDIERIGRYFAERLKLKESKRWTVAHTCLN